jgi:hypothetical protein
VDQNETPQRSSARTLAIIAIVIALTAPFWEGALLGSINIHMPMATELADNVRALDRLDRRTSELEQQLGATTAQLARLQTQLNETAGRANAAADRTATLAMVELATALRRPGGFELELAALRGTIGDPGELKPLLDQIEPYAVTGVPLSSQLRQEFARISARTQWSERGFMPVAWVMRLLPPWQRSATAAPAAPDPTPGLLTQAASQLGSGDMAGAVATVQTIGGTTQETFADWLEDAKARVAADGVLQRLNDQIAKRANRSVAAQKPGKA